MTAALGRHPRIDSTAGGSRAQVNSTIGQSTRETHLGFNTEGLDAVPDNIELSHLLDTSSQMVTRVWRDPDNSRPYTITLSDPTETTFYGSSDQPGGEQEAASFSGPHNFFDDGEDGLSQPTESNGEGNAGRFYRGRFIPARLPAPRSIRGTQRLRFVNGGAFGQDTSSRYGGS